MINELRSLPVAYQTSDLVALYDLLNRRSRRVFLFILFVILAIDLVLLIPASTLPVAAQVLPYIVIALVAVGILSSPSFGGWIAYRQMRSNFGDKPYTHSIEPEEFVASAEHWETRLSWKHIPRLECAASRLFIFTGKKAAVIVPARAFPDQDRFDRFVAAAEQRWQASRR